MRTILVRLFTAVLLVLPSSISAQANQAERMSPRLQASQLVSPAVISAAVGKEMVSLRESRTVLATQSQGGQTRSWSSRHPVLTGLLIGAVAGALLPVVILPDGGDVPAKYYIPLFSPIGAGVGAAIGFAISR